MSLDAYWAKYAETLTRIRTEKPSSLAELKVILDDFEPPSSGAAFFPGGADDTLGDAVSESGWGVNFLEGDYLWQARSRTGDVIHYVEGDVYPGPWHPSH